LVTHRRSAIKDYDAFISYSNEADSRLAAELGQGLKRLAKKWNERRALEVFFDQASLSAAPHLWEELAENLDRSRHLVLLMSPEAAASAWVNREIEHFLSSHSDDRLVLVLTQGDITWDNAAGDWSETSDAVPECLRGRLSNEPLWVDLRWAHDEEHLDLRHSRFRDAVATIAAPLHGKSKDEIEGEDVRAHRRGVRVRRTAVTALLLLLLTATAASVIAVAFRSQSEIERGLRIEVEAVNDQLDQANQDLESTNGKLDTANDDLEATNDQLDQANRDLEKTNGELDTANDDLEATNGELDQANADLKTVNEALGESNQMLNDANDELETLNSELEDANEQLALAEARASQVAGVGVCIEGDLSQALALVSDISSGLSVEIATTSNDLDFFREFLRDVIDLVDLGVAGPEIEALLLELQDSVDTLTKDLESLALQAVQPSEIPVELCNSRSGYPFRDSWQSVIDAAARRTALVLP